MRGQNLAHLQRARNAERIRVYAPRERGRRMASQESRRAELRQPSRASPVQPRGWQARGLARRTARTGRGVNRAGEGASPLPTEREEQL